MSEKQAGPFGWIDNATLEKHLNKIMAVQADQTQILQSLIDLMVRQSGLMQTIIQFLMESSTDDRKIGEVIAQIKAQADKLSAAVAASKP